MGGPQAMANSKILPRRVQCPRCDDIYRAGISDLLTEVKLKSGEDS